MGFLANPCACGFSCDETENGDRYCRACHRRYVMRPWGWTQVTPLNEVVKSPACRHARLDNCPHCAAAEAYRRQCCPSCGQGPWPNGTRWPKCRTYCKDPWHPDTFPDGGT
jgi:hypothetical protein